VDESEDWQGWTREEEAAFYELMMAGELERLPAIRMYWRFGGNVKRALSYVRRMDEASAANREQARQRIKRCVPVAESTAGGASGSRGVNFATDTYSSDNLFRERLTIAASLHDIS
jgi:hypothetical protein